ncbi:MAG: hypothetical protein PHS49_02140 [Candidatus Gracilibacteria bacterium]|nr:hypothetical protein [Candidatus Gracilibacteria bacterium]
MKKIHKYIFIVILLFVLIIGIYLVSNIYIFSDGVYHTSIIDNIIKTGNVSMKNYMGFSDFYMDDIESVPKIGDVIYFYVIVSNFALLTGLSGGQSISFIGIFFTLLSVILVYIISKKITLNSLKSLYITFLFSLAPINYWIISHRLIESVLFFLILLIFSLLINNKKYNFKGYIFFIITLLCVVIVNIKLTSIFFIFFIFLILIYLLKLKQLFKLILFGLLLVSPFLFFYFNEGTGIIPTKTISYVNHNVGIQHSLDIDSNSENIVSELLDKDSKRLRNIVYQIENRNINGITQYFSIFKTDNLLTNDHEYGKFDWSYFFLFILILFSISKYKNTKIIGSLNVWNIVMLLLFCSVYLRFATNIYRYGFYFNIIIFILIIPSFFEFIKNKYYTLVIIFLSTTILTYNYVIFNVNNNMQYIYSYDHNPLFSVKKSFTNDFEKLKENSIYNEIKQSNCTYTNSREFPYYSGIIKKWDSRINSLDDKNKFLYYYDALIGCKFIVNQIYGGKELNEKFNNIFGNPIYNGEVFVIYKYNK